MTNINVTNIIATPKYIFIEILERPGTNIQISGLSCAVVSLHPVNFWYNIRAWEAGPFATIPSDTHICTHRLQSPGSDDVAGLRSRSPETSTRQSAISISLHPAFACLFTWHDIHSHILRCYRIMRPPVGWTTCGASMGGGNGTQDKTSLWHVNVTR